MMSYPQEEIPLRSSTSDWLPGQNHSAPGCLKDSPTPQKPSSVLSALSHPMMQLKIYHGKGKLAGWKGKSEEGMFYGVYV